jgi:hypothetical protein
VVIAKYVTEQSVVPAMLAAGMEIADIQGPNGSYYYFAPQTIH